jgi:hydroxymethylpyrimidine/phosphomethylpyrimidine kinase
VASSGNRLLAPAAVDAVRRLLIPRAHVITPNLPEAALLLDTQIAHDEADMEAQARALIERFRAQAVLIKGGHGTGAESVDLLVQHGSVTRLAVARIATKNTHGTGCTLSSAIAAGLAQGLDLAAATGAAKAYVTAAIAGADALGVGHGHGPLNHFHAFWRKQ